MNRNRDQNSSEEKAVNRELLLRVGLGRRISTMNWSRDKNSWEEKAVNEKFIACWALGGKFKQ